MVSQLDQACLCGTVSGRVQGVGFRYYVVRMARRIGLSGWVKNNLDGTVSFEAAGLAADINELLEHIRTGPRSSRVDGVQVRWLEPDESTVNDGEFVVR